MIELAKASAHEPYAPLTWRFERWGGRTIVILTCPKLHSCELSEKKHSVTADGTVSPSCVCPVEGCGWHEFVRLVAWQPAGTFHVKQ